MGGSLRSFSLWQIPSPASISVLDMISVNKIRRQELVPLSIPSPGKVPALPASQASENPSHASQWLPTLDNRFKTEMPNVLQQAWPRRRPLRSRQSDAFSTEPHPPLLGREFVQVLITLRNHAVAVKPIEDNANPAALNFAVQGPVKKKIRPKYRTVVV